MPELSLQSQEQHYRKSLRAVQHFALSQRSLMGAFSRITDATLIGVSLALIIAVYAVEWREEFTLMVACAIALFAFLAQSNDLYRSWRGASLGRELVQLWLTWAGVILGLLLLDYVAAVLPKERFVTLMWFLFAPSVLTLWRSLLHRAVGALRKEGLNIRRVAIAGARDLGVTLAGTITGNPTMGLKLLGFYDDRQPAGARPLATQPHMVLGNLDTLVQKAREGKIDVIYITLPMRAETRIKDLVDKLADTTVSVYLVPDFFMFSLMNTSLGQVGNLPIVSIHETPFYGVDGWIKRVEDIVLSLAILALIAMPMLLISLAVRLTSKGPAIFKQRRYGLQGQEIMVYKFRSMTVCEDGDNVCQATKEDERITPLGRFLRRTSLDELPQFINVLQGRMSIVGPRPHAVAHNEMYRKLINGYMLRHKVKPGITGWAQVNGLRGETETVDKMKARIEYDLDYIRNWSIWLDLKIVFMTVLKGFTGKNAY